MLSQHNITLGRSQRIAALDVGTRYIGVAISDSTQSFALPHAVWEWQGNIDTLRRSLHHLRETYPLQLMILGQQDAGLHAHTVMDTVHVVSQLLHTMDIPTAMVSEYVSTVEAKNRAADVGISGRLDDIAAQIILERYLASCKNALSSD